MVCARDDPSVSVEEIKRTDKLEPSELLRDEFASMLASMREPVEQPNDGMDAASLPASNTKQTLLEARRVRISHVGLYPEAAGHNEHGGNFERACCCSGRCSGCCTDCCTDYCTDCCTDCCTNSYI